MTEPNSRVLGRMGARTLTEREIGEVGGSAGIVITDVATNFGRDFEVDHFEN